MSHPTHHEGDHILVLDAVRKDAAPRRLWVRPGQVVHFGRTHRADECFPHDAGMSSRHFLVERTADGWCCRDLKSTNGTFLNDAPIAEAILHPGDRIRAGDTTFVVVPSMSAGGTHSHAREPATHKSDAPRAAVLRQPTPGELSYRSYATPSDLRLFVGVKSNSDPAFVVQVLTKKLPPLVVSEKEHARKHCPDANMVSVDPQANEIEGSSCVLVQGPSRDALQRLVEARWGRDELVTIVSAAKVDDAIQALRELVRVSTEQSPLNAGAALRPSLLADRLLNRGTLSSESFAPLGVIFLEVFGGDRWGIITRAENEAPLQQLGFTPADAWQ